MLNLSYATGREPCGAKPLKSFVFSEICAPLATRIGTALAGYLIGSIGADQAMANEVGAGLAALLLIAGDLVGSHVRKLRIEAGVWKEIVGPSDDLEKDR